MTILTGWVSTLSIQAFLRLMDKLINLASSVSPSDQSEPVFGNENFQDI
jgi:hypothetical protein